MDELISFKTAKLARDKGFDYPTQYYTWSDIKKPENMAHSGDYGSLHTQNKYEEHYDNGKVKYYTISLPSQSLLQKWLRQEHKIEIWLSKGGKSGNKYHAKDITKDGVLIIENCKMFNTYQKALEQGLYEALKLID